MILSMRNVGRICLKLTGPISAQRDIFSISHQPPPRSLRQALSAVSMHTNCYPYAPSSPGFLKLTAVANDKISVEWRSESPHNEDGYLVQFSVQNTVNTDVEYLSKYVHRTGDDLQHTTLDGLNEMHEYTITVRAVNSFGESESFNPTKRAVTSVPLTQRLIFVELGKIVREGEIFGQWIIRGYGFTPGLISKGKISQNSPDVSKEVDVPLLDIDGIFEDVSYDDLSQFKSGQDMHFIAFQIVHGPDPTTDEYFYSNEVVGKWP
jgi:hypothetical protein